MSEKNTFVARQPELAQLDTFLDQALSGQGQVCFIAGEAGSGKTTLLDEFARHAQEKHCDLVVATGGCDAQTGAGDAYLPFRKVLNLLTGDVEGHLAQTTGALRTHAMVLRYLGIVAWGMGQYEQAARIPDDSIIEGEPLRRSFRENISWHREIVKAVEKGDRVKEMPVGETGPVQVEKGGP